MSHNFYSKYSSFKRYITVLLNVKFYIVLKRYIVLNETIRKIIMKFIFLKQGLQKQPSKLSYKIDCS